MQSENEIDFSLHPDEQHAPNVSPPSGSPTVGLPEPEGGHIPPILMMNQKYKLQAGEKLHVGEKLRSPNLKYVLQMQDDGNLVLYRHSDRHPLWATNTAGSNAKDASMQNDGNFVLYKEQDQPVWASHTAGHRGAVIQLQDDGNLVIYHEEKHLWATGTAESEKAALMIDDFHRRTGGDFGPLGSSIGPIIHQSDDLYVREFQLGKVKTDGVNATQGQGNYRATVSVAAIKCFGTDDVTTDETYAIISLISVNPSQVGEDQLVKTIKIGPQNVQQHDTFGAGATIGEIFPVGTGIKVHVALFDRESGDPEEVRAAIEEQLKELVKQGAAAIGGAVFGGDIPLAGTTSDIFQNKLVNFLTGTLSGLIADWVSDDFIDEKEFLVDAGTLRTWATQAGFEASIRGSNDLPNDIILNIPKTPEDENLKVFTNGDATYKVYLLVQSKPDVGYPILPSR